MWVMYASPDESWVKVLEMIEQLIRVRQGESFILEMT